MIFAQESLPREQCQRPSCNSLLSEGALFFLFFSLALPWPQFRCNSHSSSRSMFADCSIIYAFRASLGFNGLHLHTETPETVETMLMAAGQMGPRLPNVSIFDVPTWTSVTDFQARLSDRVPPALVLTEWESYGSIWKPAILHDFTRFCLPPYLLGILGNPNHHCQGP